MFVLLLSDEIDATSMAGVKKYDPIIDYCSLPAESNINQMKSLKEIIFGEKKKWFRFHQNPMNSTES